MSPQLPPPRGGWGYFVVASGWGRGGCDLPYVFRQGVGVNEQVEVMGVVGRGGSGCIGHRPHDLQFNL
eukprot:747852-Hanusia_phi.AAC.1